MRRWALITMAITMVGGLLSVSAPGHTSSARAATPQYYVSIGDSLAEGYQPGTADGTETLHGYSDRLVADLATRVSLTLENFGCGGATSSSILTSVGCDGGQAVDGVAYPSTTQAAAAINFLTTHPGQIGLVTVSIGGNDINGCYALSSPQACVSAVLAAMKTNVETLAIQLRAAAGVSVPILATTNSDVNVVNWLQGPNGKASAKKWIAEFRDSINPTLAQAYQPSNVKLVDITAAFGTYLPLTKLVTYAPYGKIPLAVVRICTLTWICSADNAHPNNNGYAQIASHLASAYLSLSGRGPTS